MKPFLTISLILNHYSTAGCVKLIANKLLVITVIILILTSCSGIFSVLDDKLIFHPQIENSGKLKLNGFYYSIDRTWNNTCIYYFYNNGTYINCGCPNGNIDSAFIYISDKLINGEHYKKFKPYWGLYKINKDSIFINRWAFGNGPGYHAYIDAGVIINDTTYIIKTTARQRLFRKYLFSSNDTLHFKEYKFKPDSVNDFIK